jgi:penicillin-binding protein 1A
MLAYLLQFRMNKIQILRAYLSIVYLGWGIRGIGQAARVIYGKYLWELDRRECAMIAAMMVYPWPRYPNDHWQHKVAVRAAYGLRLFARHANRYKQRFE